MKSIHLVMQVCDTQFYQVENRICGTDRTLLTLKSLTSFMASVQQSHDSRPDHQYCVRFVCDRVSARVQHYLQGLIAQYSAPRLSIDMVDLPAPGGIAASIRDCYLWLQEQGRDIVAQFQDDYIFFPEAIDDAVDMFYQAQQQCKCDPVLSLFNFPDFFQYLYHNQSVPRLIVVGRHCYWVQLYDIACPMFTSHAQFSQHWDLYTDFFYLIENKQKRQTTYLENGSINLMFTRRGVLGLQPIRNLSLHMQGQQDFDPHVDWRPLWDSIVISEDNHAITTANETI